MKRQLLCALVSAAIILGFASIMPGPASAIKTQDDAARSALPSPISINKDSDFPSYAASGTGAKADPYVIENLQINGTGTGRCIYIGNTTAYFVVRNCTLSGASGVTSASDFWNCAIALANVTNGALYNNTCISNGDDGICLWHAGFTVIANNTCTSNVRSGIGLYLSSNNTAAGNDCAGGEYGAYLSGSEGNTLSCNNFSFNTLDGITLDYSSNKNTMAANDCSGNSRHGIFLSSSSYSTSSVNAIRNNTCAGNGQNGVSVSISNDNSISGNNCSNNGNFGIYLSAAVSNTVNANDCNDNAKDGLSIYDSIYCTVNANRFSANKKYGISVSTSVKCEFSLNSLISCGFSISSNIGSIRGDEIAQWSTHTIGNTNTVNEKPVCYLKNTAGGSVPSDSGQAIVANCSGIMMDSLNISSASAGVMLGYSTECTISNLTASGGEYGVYLYHSGANAITGAALSNNTYGLYSSYSDGISIAGSAFTDNGDGAYFAHSASAEIAGCRFEGNNKSGMVLFAAEASLVNACSFENNSCGISILASSRTTIVNNHIACCTGYGLLVRYSSSYNRIHHNAFLENNGAVAQANDSAGNNFWNDSSGGNYWSDWTSPDGNGDGIVDSPYLIDGGKGAQDNKPLTTIQHVPVQEGISPAVALVCALGLLAFCFVGKRRLKI